MSGDAFYCPPAHAAPALGFHSIIESLAVYLPPTVLTTDAVLRGCHAAVQFPLERLTGIKARRAVGENEYAVDLSSRAVAECLDRSSCLPEEIDLVVCCNISRYDAPGPRFSFESATSLQLKSRFGLTRALSFDISNACAGMFTAIAVADAFLKTGAIETALVVSGEYITHLTTTAQHEIESFLDPRLACLTVGDAGVALTLRQAPKAGLGLQALDLLTLGRHSSYCVAKPTSGAHGGAIMFTDAMKLTETALPFGALHARDMMREAGWLEEAVQHVIVHQTSAISISGAMREMNRLLGKQLCTADNMIFNVAERGNTGSNTHFVALMDHMQRGRIRSGDRIVFGITGSGQTIGTALYAMDDLPGRLGDRPVKKPSPIRQPVPSWAASSRRFSTGIEIEAIGLSYAERGVRAESTALLQAAAERCIGMSSHSAKEIALVVNAGVYRTEFICEPAIAAFLAGALDLNSDFERRDAARTLAFDVLNGAMGVLNSCFLAIQMMQARALPGALITASEIENNAGSTADCLGIREAGSAILLRRSTKGAGFGSFLFSSDTRHADAFQSALAWKNGQPYLDFTRSPETEKHYAEEIARAVEDLLRRDDLALSEISVILAPQISPDFLEKLRSRLGASRKQLVDVTSPHGDLYTSSLACAFQHARENGLTLDGEIGLILSAGSGVQAGAALYYF